MKVLRRLTWGSAKFWLGTIAIVAAALAVARDAAPTSATNPEVLPSLSGSSPIYAASALLVRGGHSAGNVPCSPGDSDPTTLCLHIWAKNINNSTGVSAFQVHYTYPADRLVVSATTASTTWLSSTGRSVICPAGTFSLGEGVLSCNTLLASPYGPNCPQHCDGILVNIAVESQDVTGSATFTLVAGTNDTFLIDTPFSGEPALIPITIRSINLYVAPCADFTGDGHVTVGDILYVVSRFHTSDPGADLDGSGLVLVSDILIAIGEYSMFCTR
jgi:hypothetical protein